MVSDKEVEAAREAWREYWSDAISQYDDKEVEAAREAWREYWSDAISQYDDNKGPMEGMRRALEAAARVRAEDNAGEPVEVLDAPIAKGLLSDEDAKAAGLGRFGHHPNPAIDFEIEVESLQSRLFDAKHGISKPGTAVESIVAVLEDIQRAMSFRVGGDEGAVKAKQLLRQLENEALSALTADKPHPDDEAVDRFAAAMKAKLKWEREERGRHGWHDPEVCSEEYLARLLIEHLAKGNDGNFEDVANICMMLHQRGAHPRVLADVLMAGKSEQSGWQPIETAPKDRTKVDLWVVNLFGEGKRIPDCSWGWGQWIGPKGLSAERLGHKATHWMPLPTQPTAGGGDE